MSDEKPKQGRPTDYTPEMAARICEEMATGKSLVKICQPEDMPGKATVYMWLSKHESFRDNYTRAQEDRATAVFEELFEIADDADRDYTTGVVDEDGKVIEGVSFNREHVARTRLRLDTRKWALARMSPKRFGERISAELTGKDGGPIKVVKITEEEGKL